MKQKGTGYLDFLQNSQMPKKTIPAAIFILKQKPFTRTATRPYNYKNHQKLEKWFIVIS